MKITDKMRSAVMSELGRKGGRIGGKVTAARMTAEQLSERGRKAGSSKKLKCECGRSNCRTCYSREYQRRRRARQAVTDAAAQSGAFIKEVIGEYAVKPLAAAGRRARQGAKCC